MAEFQDRFVWPYFTLDTNALCQVGLNSLPPTMALNLYCPRLNMWTAISVNHVIHLSHDNTHIFLKPSTIHQWKNLRTHTSALPSISWIDVTAECAYLKSQMEQDHLEHALTTLATPKHNLSPALHTPVNVPPAKHSRLAEPIQAVAIVQPCSTAATRVIKEKDVLLSMGLTLKMKRMVLTHFHLHSNHTEQHPHS